MRRKELMSHQAGSLAPERERLRLLRDVHDGLGPILTGMAFGLRAVRNLLGRDEESAARLLAQLEEELYGAITELRRLTNDIHPDVLDRLGLVDAIRLYAMALSERVPCADGGRLHIEVCAHGDLSTVPPPVLVAAYRISCEALNNMARHSRARSGMVCLRLDGNLHVEVVDDGVGIPGGDMPLWSGIGLRSMRDRTRELGGVWAIETGALGGTRVAATFPVNGA